MNLGDFLDASRAVVPLPGETLASAVEALVQRLDGAGVVADVERLRKRIAEDRAEDLVTMGGRAFLLHYRTDAVRELAVAIGTASSPICLLSPEEEGPCARVVIVVVTPPKQAGRYLQLLGAFGRALQREEDATRLLDARTGEELVGLPLFREVELPQHLTVRDLMTDRPRTTTSDAPLHEAAWQMLRGGLGALPVVDAEYRLVGMLSDRDLLREVVMTLQGGPPKPSQAHGSARQVRDLMTRHVLCVAPEQPLAEVASLMSHKDVDRVPVVREGRLVGFLTRGDILRKLMGF